MSTRRDLVRSALTDEPQGRTALADTLGLEAQAVSMELNVLQREGHAARADGGWIASDGAQAPRRHESAASPEGQPGAPHQTRQFQARNGRKTRGAKPRPKTARAPKISPPNGRHCEFAIGESGAVLFKMTSGPRAGELGSIAPADVLALYALLSACDFITENA